MECTVWDSLIWIINDWEIPADIWVPLWERIFVTLASGIKLISLYQTLSVCGNILWNKISPGTYSNVSGNKRYHDSVLLILFWALMKFWLLLQISSSLATPSPNREQMLNHHFHFYLNSKVKQLTASYVSWNMIPATPPPVWLPILNHFPHPNFPIVALGYPRGQPLPSKEGLCFLVHLQWTTVTLRGWCTCFERPVHQVLQTVRAGVNPQLLKTMV